MRIVGRKIVRNNNSEINSNPEVVVNPVTGNMRINGKAMESLELKDKVLGFAYPDDGEDKIYMWSDDPVAEGEKEEGVKINDKGMFTSRFHSRELNRLLMDGNKDKFKIRIKTDPISIEPHKMTFWEIYIENNSETTETEVEEGFVEAEESSIEDALESDFVDSHHTL